MGQIQGGNGKVCLDEQRVKMSFCMNAFMRHLLMYSELEQIETMEIIKLNDKQLKTTLKYTL